MGSTGMTDQNVGLVTGYQDFMQYWRERHQDILKCNNIGIALYKWVKNKDVVGKQDVFVGHVHKDNLTVTSGWTGCTDST